VSLEKNRNSTIFTTWVLPHTKTLCLLTTHITTIFLNPPLHVEKNDNDGYLSYKTTSTYIGTMVKHKTNVMWVLGLADYLKQF
jgi:hypothetical protein